MSETPCEDWVNLLHTAKEIRRTMRPVAPSPGFQDHLRSDLASALGSGESRAPANLIIRIRRPRYRQAQMILGASLGLAAAALALILMRRRR